MIDKYLMMACYKTFTYQLFLSLKNIQFITFSFYYMTTVLSDTFSIDRLIQKIKTDNQYLRYVIMKILFTLSSESSRVTELIENEM